jgi:hypothetical protein
MKCALVEHGKNLRLMDASLATIVDASFERERGRHKARYVSLVEVSTGIRIGEISDG